MPVGQMLKCVSGHELAEWQAFEELYGPIGVEASIDRAAALIAERVTNCLTRQQPAPTQDTYLPHWRRRHAEDYDPEEDPGGADAP